LVYKFITAKTSVKILAKTNILSTAL